MVEGRPPAGWYPDPNGTLAHRYWDGSQWTEQVSPAAAPEQVAGPGRSHEVAWVLVTVLVTVTLAILYFRGTFDTMLVNAGININANPCVKTEPAGDTFCGGALETLCEEQPAFRRGNSDACRAVGID